MNTGRFRQIALGMKDVVESDHMHHPDFRIKGKIFASIHKDGQYGMVKLTPNDQQRFVQEDPGAFLPENGAWGRMGYTKVRLDTVDEDVLGEAMTLAWKNTAASASKPKPSPRKR